MATTAKTGTTIYATPSDREVSATRVFDAPRKLVWDAHTKPEHVAQWMTGLEGWTMPVCEIDLRPGGAWHYVWRKGSTAAQELEFTLADGDGSEMGMRGVYKEVQPPERLVNTESWGEGWPETINTLVFSEKDGRTTLVETVLYPSREARDQALETGAQEGWSISFDRLDAYLQTMR